jgi:ACS family hexuronate transporter-like MFS transporter
MDRNALAVLASTIQSEFHWSDIDYSNITVCFVISYTIMYALSGRIIDRIGTRKGFAIFGGGWSIVSMLHAFANTIFQFGIVRFFLGMLESANFPAGVKACTEWFPIKERALAIGVFNAGTAIGAAIAVPLLSFMAWKFGWRSAFLLTGILGIVWLLFWLKYYRISQRTGTETEGKDIFVSKKEEKCSVKRLLSKKETWGCISARIFIDPVTYFMLFWIPKYLQDTQGLSLSEMGVTAWLPYLGMGVGTVLGGAIPKYLIDKQRWSLNKARKTTMLISSFLIPLLCCFLFIKTSTYIAIVLLTLILVAHGLWANITIPSEIYPKQVQATLTGIGGTIGGISGVITQKMVGTIVSNYSYLPIFVYIGSAYIISYILVCFLVGKLGEMKTI